MLKLETLLGHTRHFVIYSAQFWSAFQLTTSFALLNLHEMYSFLLHSACPWTWTLIHGSK